MAFSSVTIISMKTGNTNAKQISWNYIEPYLHEDFYRDFLKQINLSVFRMALTDADRPKMVKAILKVLKERDPQNANEEFANKMADRMKELARMALAK